MNKMRTFKIKLPDPKIYAKELVEEAKRLYPKTYKKLGE